MRYGHCGVSTDVKSVTANGKAVAGAISVPGKASVNDVAVVMG